MRSNILKSLINKAKFKSWILFTVFDFIFTVLQIIDGILWKFAQKSHWESNDNFFEKLLLGCCALNFKVWNFKLKFEKNFWSLQSLEI